MTKGRGFLGLAPKTTFLVQILEIVFDKTIGNPLSFYVCKLTLLELECGCTIVSRARLDLPWVANACLASV